MKKILFRFMILALAVSFVACQEDEIIRSQFEDGPDAKPEASFTFTQEYLKVTFKTTSTNAESYYWDFGDGAHSTDSTPVHTYAAAGTYNVVLKVNSPDGYSSSSDTTSIYVAGPVSAYLEITFLSFLEVNFDASKSSNIKTATWDFGDGSPEVEGINVTHEYADFGTYEIKLTVTGLLDDVEELVETIRVGEEVEPAYTYSAGVGHAVNFDASESKNVRTVKWNFGDGSPEVEGAKIAHWFPADGTYQVTLTLIGVLGDVVEISFEVVVVGKYNFIEGGSMEATDADYWTIISNNATPSNIGPWVPTFGYTDDAPAGGSGGCLSLFHPGGNSSFRIYVYQEVEVEAGRQYRLHMDLKIPANVPANIYVRHFIGGTSITPGTNTPIGSIRGEAVYEGGATGRWAELGINVNGYNGSTFNANSPFDLNGRQNTWTATTTGKIYVGFGIYYTGAAPLRMLYDNVKFELISTHQ
jgi:PKD repeat protein